MDRSNPSQRNDFPQPPQCVWKAVVDPSNPFVKLSSQLGDLSLVELEVLPFLEFIVCLSWDICVNFPGLRIHVLFQLGELWPRGKLKGQSSQSGEGEEKEFDSSGVEDSHVDRVEKANGVLSWKRGASFECRSF